MFRYNPKKYWKKREVAAPLPLPDYAEKYIRDQIKDAETILDYGIGEGRLLKLYEGKEVTGYDIVPRQFEDIPVIYELIGRYDVVVASKVLLHVRPENIARVIDELRGITDKVVVFDTVADCKAKHNFRHDFENYGPLNDKEIHGEDLLFWYGGKSIL